MSTPTSSTSGSPSKAAVVVGFDGSEGSRLAALWASADAQARDGALLLVAAFETPLTALPTWGPTQPVTDPRTAVLLRRQLEDQLEDMARECRQAAPESEVRAAIVDGPPAKVLGAAAVEADVLVVGSAGLGALPRLFLGSTAAELVRASDRPVVVVRDGSDGDAVRVPAEAGRVVVGVDGSDASTRAVGFAYDFAARHGCELVGVHVWALPPETLVDTWTPEVDRDRLQADADTVVAQALADWQQRYPKVRARRHVVPGRPAPTLIEQATGATLLVVGSRGHGVVRRMLLGSVSHAVIYNAPCSVAVVGQPHSD